MRKEPFCERLEHKVLGGKGNKLENWIYDTFFTLDPILPKNLRYDHRKKMLAYAQNELLAKYNEKAKLIANRLNTTPNEVTISCFKELDAYVASIYAQHRSGSSTRKIQEWIDSLMPIKENLMELLEGTSIETLEIAGKPFYDECGWRSDKIYWFLSGVQSKFGIPSCYDLKTPSTKRVRFKFFHE